METKSGMEFFVRRALAARTLAAVLSVAAATAFAGAQDASKSDPPKGAATEAPKVADAAKDAPAVPKTGRLSADMVPECREAQKKFQENKPKECMELLEKAARLHPRLPPADVMFATLLINSNQAGLGRMKLEQAARERPDHPEVFRTFGELAIVENRLTDAWVHFEKAVRLAGSETWPAEVRRNWLAFAHSGLANVAERRNDWKTAYDVLYFLHELDKEDSSVRYRMGRALFFLDKYESAMAQLRIAAKADPRIEPAELAAAGFWATRGDVKKAEELLNGAAKLYPKDTRVFSSQAAFYINQARADEARVAAKKAAQLDGKSLQGPLLEGLAARQAKDLAAAEEIFQKMHNQNPSEFAWSNQLALVLVEQADPTKKKRGLELAGVNQQRFQQNVEAATTFGWALYQNGRKDEAEKALGAALNTSQPSADCAYYSALLLEEKGRVEDAVKVAQKTLSVTGTFIHRKDCAELVERLKSAKKKE